VASLKTTIAQIRQVPAGASVGYERVAIMEKDTRIATVRIGYADGYDRRFSNGVGKMFVKGFLFPVVGMVCMDMTMIYLGKEHDIHLNDEVEVLGEHISIIDLAESAQTIPYEILTSIGSRIKRIYFES
jgi:alanine racemase